MPDDVLSLLKDIHTPPAVSWWPLAVGYWILLIMAVVALFWFVRRYRQHWVRRTAQRQFDHLLERYKQHHDAELLTQNISTLMRRISISLLPREQVAGVTGEQWIAVLQNLGGEKTKSFSPLVADALTTLVHRPGANRLLSEHVEQLVQECRQWIRGLPTTGVAK